MPPKKKITREMIVHAAFEIARYDGYECINARNIARKLNCSTQPVMYAFHTVDEIKKETYIMADRFHTEYIMPKGESGIPPMLELGLNYIRFGHEESNLFRLLFQSNSFSGFSIEMLMNDPALNEILEMISAGMGCDAIAAKNIFFRLFISAHGCASLLANNGIEYDEAIFRQVLESTCSGIMNRGFGK